MTPKEMLVFPPVANARIQPLDSSARNPLICNEDGCDLVGFAPVSGSEVGARNGQERVECCPERAETLTGEVRRLPQEPPTTRGNQRDRARKNPNRERLGF